MAASRSVKDPLYNAWRSMRWRCTNKNHEDYPRYGGRGIKVDPRWDDFANFAADMGPHPGKGWSLDRKKNNQNYRHGNCRWATYDTQNRNRNLSTRSGKLTLAKVARIRKLYAGDARSKRGSISQQALADRYGITRSMVSYIIKEGHHIDLMSFSDLTDFTGSTEELDQMIEWKAGSMGVLKHYGLGFEEAAIQRQFTIELRCDFADRDKLPELKKTLLVAARHCFATASLLADTPKTTQIAIFSNDFFSPPEEIKMMDDLIQQGIDATGGNDEQQDDTISADLAAAVTG